MAIGVTIGMDIGIDINTDIVIVWYDCISSVYGLRVSVFVVFYECSVIIACSAIELGKF